MLKKMYCQFKDEVDGVKEYYECAIKHKDSRPEFAKIYADMASAELEHATEILAMVKKMVSEESAKMPEDHPPCMTAGEMILEIMEEQMMHARAMKMAYE